MRAKRSIILSALAVVLYPLAARGDTLDLLFLSRFGDRDSIPEVLALDVLFMGVNYALNFLFVGFLAMRCGKIAANVMAFDIFLFTLGGQFADRIGAIVTRVIAGPHLALSIYRHPLDWDSAGFFITLNFLTTALAIGGLALLFGCRRWHLSTKGRCGAAVVAAVFTNPAYVMVIEVLRYQRFLESLGF